MLYNWYNKPNKLSLSLFVCFWIIAIIGFVQAMDYFKKPFYIGYVVIFASFLEIIRLIRNFRKNNSK